MSSGFKRICKLSAICLTAFSVCFSASAKDSLTVGFYLPAYSVLDKAANSFADHLNQISGGKMSAEIYSNGYLGSQSEMLRKVETGQLDIVFSSSSYLASYAGQFNVLSLPFFYDSYSQARESLNGEGGDYLKHILREHGLEHLGWMTLGFNQTSSNRLILTCDDYRKVKYAYNPEELLSEETIAAMGARPVAVNPASIYDVMAQKQVNAVCDTYSEIFSAKLEDYCRYLIEINQNLEVVSFIASRKTLAELTSEQQSWLKRAAAMTCDEEWQMAEDNNMHARSALINSGMTLIKFDNSPLKESVNSTVYAKYRQLYPDIFRKLNR